MLYSPPTSEHFTYDVALSFPGELRPLANKLKACLNKFGLEVFCETDTVGKNPISISSGYATQSILIVTFFSEKYGYSDFCQEEWHKIRENWDILHDRVLPLRFDETYPGYAVSKQIGIFVNKEMSPKDLSHLVEDIHNQLKRINSSWCSEESQVYLTVVGSDSSTDKIQETFSSHLIALLLLIPYIKKEFKRENIQALVNTFSELVVLIDGESLKAPQKTQVQFVAKERDKMFKRTLFLVPKQTKRQDDLLTKWFAENVSQSGAQLFILPNSLADATDYLSRLTHPVCNVFFDDSSIFSIRQMRKELYSEFPKIAAVRWYDLSVLGDRSQPFTQCTMIDSACREQLEENIYLISEKFFRLATDGDGHPENSSVISLLPRIVDYRTNGRVKQTFMFAKNDAKRILSDPAMRSKLVHYWRYAEPLLYTDTSALKNRIKAMCSNS